MVLRGDCLVSSKGNGVKIVVLDGFKRVHLFFRRCCAGLDYVGYRELRSFSGNGFLKKIFTKHRTNLKKRNLEMERYLISTKFRYYRFLS